MKSLFLFEARTIFVILLLSPICLFSQTHINVGVNAVNINEYYTTGFNLSGAGFNLRVSKSLSKQSDLRIGGAYALFLWCPCEAHYSDGNEEIIVRSLREENGRLFSLGGDYIFHLKPDANKLRWYGVAGGGLGIFTQESYELETITATRTEIQLIAPKPRMVEQLSIGVGLDRALTRKASPFAEFKLVYSPFQEEKFFIYGIEFGVKF